MLADGGDDSGGGGSGCDENGNGSGDGTNSKVCWWGVKVALVAAEVSVIVANDIDGGVRLVVAIVGDDNDVDDNGNGGSGNDGSDNGWGWSCQ